MNQGPRDPIGGVVQPIGVLNSRSSPQPKGTESKRALWGLTLDPDPLRGRGGPIFHKGIPFVSNVSRTKWERGYIKPWLNFTFPFKGKGL